jgi:hypothetical protein
MIRQIYFLRQKKMSPNYKECFLVKRDRKKKKDNRKMKRS